MAVSNDADFLRTLDDSKIRGFHWRTIFTTGMGFFTDAYDLFIIGTVTTILTPLWHLSGAQTALLNSLSLAASVLGAVIFGRLMDRLGRKFMYGWEAVLLVIGALVSAAAPDFTWLLIGRIIVGLGVGGDYPTSSVIASEYANRPERGFMVTMVFAMQGLGLVIGPLIAAALLASGMDHETVWRLLLGLGAVPAAAVIYLRRKMPETPRYLAILKQDKRGARDVASRLAQREVAGELPSYTRQSLLSARNFPKLFGAMAGWFLLDIAFYGNGISIGQIMKQLEPHADLLHSVLLSAGIFAVAALPGYFVAAVTMDRLGRRFIQVLGFAIMAAAYALIFFAPDVVKMTGVFLLIYGVSYFFIEFGPNTTTFLIPSEVLPANVRGVGHGLAAAAGKAGAFLGAFFLPLVLKQAGIGPTMGILAVVSLLGVLVTLFFVPEMRQRSIEDNEHVLSTRPAFSTK